MNRFGAFFQYLFFYFGLSRETKKKRLEKIRSTWGVVCRGEKKFKLISILHNLQSNSHDEELVDEKTWQDLNLDEIFSKMDGCQSVIGSQYFYHQLHSYKNDKDYLSEQTRQYDIFRQEKETRENIQLALACLGREQANNITYLLYDELPDKPKYSFLLYISSFLSIVLVAEVFIYPPIFFWVLFFVVLNIILHGVYSTGIYNHFAGLNYLNTMIGVAQKLAELPNKPALPQLNSLKRHKPIYRSLKKRIGWLVMDKSGMGDLGETVVEYLNTVCLFDVIAFIRSIEYLKQYKSTLREIYTSIASLDTSIAVASYLESLEYHTVPQVNADRLIDAVNLYHPLLDNPVANSIRLDSRSALVTGSNMAGKTTFIKTVGVNVILGRTLNFCLAERADIPRSVVITSIRRVDDIFNDKSYYFVEVEHLLRAIELSKSGNDYLFIIDEIYRGTNAIERISAATAVLSYLSEKQQVMVTTHDVELQELLNDNFDMYHFSEQVEGERYYFDYRLSAGPCNSRNAIKLLRLSGYPESVTARADSLAQELKAKYDR